MWKCKLASKHNHPAFTLLILSCPSITFHEVFPSASLAASQWVIPTYKLMMVPHYPQGYNVKGTSEKGRALAPLPRAIPASLTWTWLSCFSHNLKFSFINSSFDVKNLGIIEQTWMYSEQSYSLKTLGVPSGLKTTSFGSEFFCKTFFWHTELCRGLP